MKTAELIEQCKAELHLQTDYKLAKEWNIPNNRMSDYKHGKVAPDEYLYFKIAETLGKSPTIVIAEIQAEKQKDEDKRLFFQRFFTILGLWITLGVILPNYTPFSKDVYAAGNRADIGITGHYTN